jgi:hypothetical protein
VVPNRDIRAGEQQRLREQGIQRRDVRIQLSGPQASFQVDDLRIGRADEDRGHHRDVHFQHAPPSETRRYAGAGWLEVKLRRLTTATGKIHAIRRDGSALTSH